MPWDGPARIASSGIAIAKSPCLRSPFSGVIIPETRHQSPKMARLSVMCRQRRRHAEENRMDNHPCPGTTCPGTAQLVSLLRESRLRSRWRTLWGSQPAYSLADLAEWTPEISQWTRPGAAGLTAIGRNCDAFDAVRRWAYRHVMHRKADGVTLTEWRAMLRLEAELYTANAHRVPLPPAECRSIGDSIGRWTWRRFSAAGFRAVQAARGRKSGRARREESSARDGEIRKLAADRWTHRAIAERVGVIRARISTDSRRR